MLLIHSQGLQMYQHYTFVAKLVWISLQPLSAEVIVAFLSYFAIAVIRCHNQGNLYIKKKHLTEDLLIVSEGQP